MERIPHVLNSCVWKSLTIRPRNAAWAILKGYISGVEHEHMRNHLLGLDIPWRSVL